MRPLRYSINVTLDGCCDHREMFGDEDLHRHAADNLDQADALVIGRVTYEMMEAAFRPPARTGARPDWMARSSLDSQIIRGFAAGPGTAELSPWATASFNSGFSP